MNNPEDRRDISHAAHESRFDLGEADCTSDALDRAFAALPGEETMMGAVSPSIDGASDPELGINSDDPANDTLRGVDSPLIAPRGSGTRLRDRGERASDEGFRFSGASMSYGQIVITSGSDEWDANHARENLNSDIDDQPVSRTAEYLLISAGIAGLFTSVIFFLLSRANA